MVDEFKSIRDSLFKTLSGLTITTREDDDDTESEDKDDRASGGPSSGVDARAAKALLGALFAKAGKSKDDIVQIIAREIGLTVAAMLKEPLTQIAKHQKLQISFELVPKEKDKGSSAHTAHDAKRSDVTDQGHRPARRRPTKRSSHRPKV